jgi:hypothetical protein
LLHVIAFGLFDDLFWHIDWTAMRVLCTNDESISNFGLSASVDAVEFDALSSSSKERAKVSVWFIFDMHESNMTIGSLPSHISMHESIFDFTSSRMQAMFLPMC